MRIRKPIVFTIEKTDSGFSAFSESYPIYTTGSSISDLAENALEASSLFFEDQKHNLTHEEIKFKIDWKQFFKYYRVLNSRFLAEKIGMNPTLLSQYIQGKRKPSERQTKRILEGIHDIGRELMELRFSDKPLRDNRKYIS